MKAVNPSGIEMYYVPAGTELIDRVNFPLYRVYLKNKNNGKKLVKNFTKKIKPNEMPALSDVLLDLTGTAIQCLLLDYQEFVEACNEVDFNNPRLITLYLKGHSLADEFEEFFGQAAWDAIVKARKADFES